ncbi:histidine kinase [Aquimarina hainanensis]|uniref:Histidine kinase n=1 Tax=Aquimarina hainanensis TaxID=1578017 RepID=A0ABW5N9W5_9FLAO|nr:histidine kinase [Aquimarina sp. TRL1]QKX03569.1 histidine kinase [Aquimarina sp. TRL1]
MSTNHYSTLLYILIGCFLFQTAYSKNFYSFPLQDTKIDSAKARLRKKIHNAKERNDAKKYIQYSLRLLRQEVHYELTNTDTEALFSLLDYCGEKENIDCLAETHMMIAKQFHKGEQYLEALDYFKRARELSQNSDSKNLKWEILICQGLLLSELYEYKLARENYIESLNYCTNNKYRTATSILNISATYTTGTLDSMVYYSSIALDKFKKIDPKTVSGPHLQQNIKTSVNNIAYGYIKQQKLLKAKRIIAENIDLNKTSHSQLYSFDSFFFHTLGELHYKLKEYDKAIEYYNRSIDTVIQNHPASNTYSLNDLAEIYEIKGDYKKANVYLKAKENYVKEVERLNIKKELAKTEYHRVLKKKNQIISTLEEKNIKTNKQVSNIRIIAITTGVFSLFSILIFLAFYQKSRLKIAQLNEEISLTRLKSLKSMMNPHFLFNSFNTLQSLILQKDKFQASEHMRSLSQLIRKTLFNADSLFIKLNEELEILETYIKLENERFDNQFILHKSVDQTLINMDPKIPSMIIQPHIENAILHGLSHKDKKILKIHFKKKGNLVQCIVEDNGIGREKSKELNTLKREAHLSIASKNTSERINLLKKIGYKETALHVDDLYDTENNPIGTRIIIDLPIIK